METYVIVITIIVLILTYILYNQEVEESEIKEPTLTTTITLANPVITEATNFTLGQPIMCSSNDPNGRDNINVYRYMGDNTMNWYPNPPIASSWDPNWRNFSKINCNGLSTGPNMELK